MVSGQDCSGCSIDTIHSKIQVLMPKSDLNKSQVFVVFMGITILFNSNKTQPWQSHYKKAAQPVSAHFVLYIFLKASLGRSLGIQQRPDRHYEMLMVLGSFFNWFYMFSVFVCSQVESRDLKSKGGFPLQGRVGGRTPLPRDLSYVRSFVLSFLRSWVGSAHIL